MPVKVRSLVTSSLAPEVIAAERLHQAGANWGETRLALTFTAAMSRACDADRLWGRPLLARGLVELADVLRQAALTRAMASTQLLGG